MTQYHGDAQDGAALAAEFLPMPSDPRILLTMASDRHAALHTLWSLALRLTKLLDDAREPMIGQIKLAWWRDMMAMVSRDADALPKGEPLLAEFQTHWHGVSGIETLVDAAEELLMAEDVKALSIAGADFGHTLFALSARCLSAERVIDADAGRAWGLLWGAYIHRGTEDGALMLNAAGDTTKIGASQYGGQRGLLMLDRLAQQIGHAQGARDLRREGLLLLRIGLLGR